MTSSGLYSTAFSGQRKKLLSWDDVVTIKAANIPEIPFEEKSLKYANVSVAVVTNQQQEHSIVLGRFCSRQMALETILGAIPESASIDQRLLDYLKALSELPEFTATSQGC